MERNFVAGGCKCLRSFSQGSNKAPSSDDHDISNCLVGLGDFSLGSLEGLMCSDSFANCIVQMIFILMAQSRHLCSPMHLQGHVYLNVSAGLQAGTYVKCTLLICFHPNLAWFIFCWDCFLNKYDNLNFSSHSLKFNLLWLLCMLLYPKFNSSVNAVQLKSSVFLLLLFKQRHLSPKIRSVAKAFLLTFPCPVLSC